MPAVPASPERPPRARPRAAVHTDQHDRGQSEVDRADPRLIEQAAARHGSIITIIAAYAGLEHKHLGASWCLSDG
jgi:hypothetical protein